MASEAARAIEAILMVADTPIDANLLAQVTEVPVGEVEQLLDELALSYDAEDRGFVLAKVAGGYRFQSHPDLAPYVERFVLEGQTARLSAAALETLAIVAYKQPISRAQVAAIRGVNVDGVVRTLEQRGYIGEVGRDPGPGQPVLFGTTDLFLERMGLASLDDLPPIADFVPGPDVVEALEHGLRADPVDRADEGAVADADDVVVAVVETTEEVVVDDDGTIVAVIETTDEVLVDADGEVVAEVIDELVVDADGEITETVVVVDADGDVVEVDQVVVDEVDADEVGADEVGAAEVDAADEPGDQPGAAPG